MSKCTLPHDHEELPDSLLYQMPPDDDFLVISTLFKQLSDPSRTRIFWLLCHCEECVINISSLVKMSSPAVAHHLKLLRMNGLITYRRDGKEVYYKAADTAQTKLLHEMIEKTMALSCPRESQPEAFSPKTLPLQKHVDTSHGQSEKKASSQEALIRDIHDFLTMHLDKRFTIEELSKKYLINTSSLKSLFKAAYGQPIASYMKEFRIRRAMELLRRTDDTIFVIAKNLGYENQGKFTKAFKEIVQMTPREYRKCKEGAVANDKMC
ncbi:MAG: metalloregulator ArsR/SmtB family transcription factor [Lachnospiraceae bacterium]|nr:metalloregulator ArsR/SmtB family transcription factor [Lachnospiraceae bacterium]